MRKEKKERKSVHDGATFKNQKRGERESDKRSKKIIIIKEGGGVSHKSSAEKLEYQMISVNESGQLIAQKLHTGAIKMSRSTVYMPV